MTNQTTAPPDGRPAARLPAARWPQVRRRLSMRVVGGLYVLAALVLVASILLPETFPTVATLRQVLGSNAITALAALALLLPLVAGDFDLSFAYTMSLSGVVAARLVAENGAGPGVALLAGVGIGIAMGVINSVVVVGLRIGSFIGTLATGALVQSFVTYVTGDNDITSAALFGDFAAIGQFALGGFVLPIWYVLVLAVALWFLLAHTATGRRLYAVGFNADAARLAGIRTDRLRTGALISCGALAGFTGVVLAAVLGSGSTTAGTPYLLPAFAVVFLGATQFNPGRFNVWGTLLSVLLLGTGLTTLALAQAPTWAGNMFTGAALLVALVFAADRPGWLPRRGRPDPSRADPTGPPADGPADPGRPAATAATTGPSTASAGPSSAAPSSTRGTP